MRKILSGNLKRYVNWLILVIFMTLLLIVNGKFGILEYDNSKTNTYLKIIGYLIVTAVSSLIFWYQNYVQWNKKGILIKLKSIFGKNIIFKDIQSSELTDKKLIIIERYGNTNVLDLNHILEADTLRLYEIMIKNTTAKTA